MLAGLLALAALPAAAEEFITVASATSTENSGLFGYLLPKFQEKTSIEVRVVAQGTGQALETARRGDADVVFVHARPAEEAFVAEGWGAQRFEVMYNDFVIVGPSADPAGIAGSSDAVAAMAKIAAAEVPFASRGDDSGTHQAEKALWAKAGITPAGDWYRETGSGMGATLNIAAEMPAYALTDRGTWISFNNKADLAILTEGDPALFNQYGVILVNPAKHPHVKAEAGQAFIDWLISPEGQAAIASYKIDGQQLFFPNAAGA
jgi:tungstate transport system substrate-binding protein